MIFATLGDGHISTNYLSLEQKEQHFMGMDSTRKTFYLGNPVVTILNGKDAGSVLEDSILRGIGHYELSFGPYLLNKFPALITVNPALLAYGQVSYPSYLLPKDTGALTLVLSNFKQVNLGDVGWIMRVGISTTI